MPTKRTTTKSAAPPGKAEQPPSTPPRITTELTPAHVREMMRFGDQEIPHTHQEIIDAVAEILTHGGHSDDVEALLRASLRHISRRTKYELPGKQSDERAATFARDHIDEWKVDLGVVWLRNRQRDLPEALEPKTVTDLIRFNAREKLRVFFFERFLTTAWPEEIRLMVDIPGTWEAGPMTGCGPDQVGLGDAFEEELGRDTSYLRVPRELIPKMEKYLDALRAVDVKDLEEKAA